MLDNILFLVLILYILAREVDNYSRLIYNKDGFWNDDLISDNVH